MWSLIDIRPCGLGVLAWNNIIIRSCLKSFSNREAKVFQTVCARSAQKCFFYKFKEIHPMIETRALNVVIHSSIHTRQLPTSESVVSCRCVDVQEVWLGKKHRADMSVRLCGWDTSVTKVSGIRIGKPPTTTSLLVVGFRNRLPTMLPLAQWDAARRFWRFDRGVKRVMDWDRELRKVSITSLCGSTLQKSVFRTMFIPQHRRGVVQLRYCIWIVVRTIHRVEKPSEFKNGWLFTHQVETYFLFPVGF